MGYADWRDVTGNKQKILWKVEAETWGTRKNMRGQSWTCDPESSCEFSHL